MIVILALMVAFGGFVGGMNWTDAKPLGLDVVGVDARAYNAVCAAGGGMAKFRIERAIFGISAADVEAIVDACDLGTVVLHAGVTGYDPAALVREWNDGGWGALVNARPDVTWWVEIGNEPEYAGFADMAAAREATLRTYKTVALGIGSGEAAWRASYPALRWMASLPVTAERAAAYLEWVPDNRYGWVNQGAIGDWFDGVGIHVYGHGSVTDGESWAMYNAVIRRADVKACAVTEAGINGRNPEDGMRELAGLARWTPCIGVFAFAYFSGACDWGGETARNYHLCDPEYWRVMGSYNAGRGG